MEGGRDRGGEESKWSERGMKGLGGGGREAHGDLGKGARGEGVREREGEGREDFTKR